MFLTYFKSCKKKELSHRVREESTQKTFPPRNTFLLTIVLWVLCQLRTYVSNSGHARRYKSVTKLLQEFFILCVID